MARQYIYHISSPFRRCLAIACLINGEKPAHYAKRKGYSRKTVSRRLTETRMRCLKRKAKKERKG